MLRSKNNNRHSCDLQEEIHVANFNKLLMISSVLYFCSSNKIARVLHLVGGERLSVLLQQAGIKIATFLWYSGKKSCSTNFSWFLQYCILAVQKFASILHLGWWTLSAPPTGRDNNSYSCMIFRKKFMSSNQLTNCSWFLQHCVFRSLNDASDLHLGWCTLSSPPPPTGTFLLLLLSVD